MTIYILVCAVAACASGPIVITRMTDKCVANTVVENIYHSKAECEKRARLSCGCVETKPVTPNEMELKP